MMMAGRGPVWPGAGGSWLLVWLFGSRCRGAHGAAPREARGPDDAIRILLPCQAGGAGSGPVPGVAHLEEARRFLTFLLVG
jgi:hypothetical protein